MRSNRDQMGQASVELTALIPLLVLLAAACWQALLVGQAVSSAGAAARSAARAAAVGGDAQAAARRVVPRGVRSGVHVRLTDGGAVRVRVAIPAVVGGMALGSVTARARLSEAAP